MNTSSGPAAKNYSVTLPRNESRKIVVYGGDGIDLDKEAEHVAEALGALADAKYHAAQIKNETNRIMVSMSLPRIEQQLDRERKAIAHEHFKAERRVAAYKAEAAGVAIFDALGIPNETAAYRLRALEGEIDRAEAEAQRKAQRDRERAIFDAAALAVERRPERAKKVSDANLLAEVRTKRHSSISDVARAVGLSVPTTWNRLNALTKDGKLGDDEVPRGAQGRPRGRGGAAGKAT